ncbi:MULTISPECIES: Rrf2 family transcriptional regulator [unclassified Acinetobacter]|uniref:Rrf2 family transcriptional regulator n=1 Tax=unclassified Acinetobacter TaxID=196816 RepID=UPI002448DBBB|nr:MULTISPECIES: Rrf2 family transcriptional regulator [unclassified Acinetobacter]MDH0030023.1 Rrf2 family transcriptional regulator [Acinetobacter sp. GD04021]MDH0885145.1 Rrf2 family transcriptional regulator [Acinetobacter sp. GD03873]MDH1082211.1 Rrf2 family transcriptional regulator [Acinetobacter sp. GD03983]MDH2188414.1 Rrf2 family transcriptional regulator [Acinetobacter sp. GD03645]MDH2202063.1 Rrf2 family transcriptional regulator [Acinetobacter sp. GD03647]
MRTDSKLSRMLHVLLHMARQKKTFTSDEIAQMLSTNPVVVRRTMSGLKKAGFVHSEKGAGGGWQLTADLEKITLWDIYQAVGEPTIFAIGNERENPECLVEQVVNAALDHAIQDAQNILIRQLKATTLASLAAQFDHLCEMHSH